MAAEPSAEVLGGVVRRTLEDAAFIFAEETGDPPRFDGTVIAARLGYAGPTHGEIRLAATPSFAAMLAANLLGTEPDDPQALDRAMDAVGELLNMVGGILVAEMFGAQTDCRLGLPAVNRVSSEDHQRDLVQAACRVSLIEEAGQRIDAAVLTGTCTDAEGA